jgi:hypothetical protein
VTWNDYAVPLIRRWYVVAAIVLLDVVIAGYLYRKATHTAQSQACLTLYVADVSSPSLIAAAGTNLDTTAQLLAGETAANFFGDDILDVAQSKDVAHYLSQSTPGHPGLDGAVSGARQDRTVNLCVTNASAGIAAKAAKALGRAMTADRASFIGTRMAARTYVRVISPPTVSAVSTSHDKVDLLLRFVLGLAVAIAVGYAWDALDPRVRDERDVEQVTRAPVLATIG